MGFITRSFPGRVPRDDCLIGEKRGLVYYSVDLLNGTVVEGEAVVDTGSMVTLLNMGIVFRHAPALLR